MEYIEKALLIVPERVRAECLRVFESRIDYPEGLMEIRLRSPGRSSILISGENVALASRVTREEIEEALSRLSGGSLYAFRDTIREGYIPMAGGGRVGICGHARYDGDKCVGISEVTSLVIRIPRPPTDIAREAARIILDRGGGALIYSPPCSGKTTALRSLALILGSGRKALRVVVVDERCEFNPADYGQAQVDVLRGYRRCEGIEIALRTMSPEVIIIDEIGSESEALSLSRSARLGVPIIASVHADGIEGIIANKPVFSLVEAGAFKTLFRVFKNGAGKFQICEVEAEKCLNT